MSHGPLGALDFDQALFGIHEPHQPRTMRQIVICPFAHGLVGIIRGCDFDHQVRHLERWAMLNYWTAGVNKEGQIRLAAVVYIVWQPDPDLNLGAANA